MNTDWVTAIEDWLRQNPLKLARTERKITQGDLALRVGVTSTTIASWERRGQRPSLKNIEKLAKVFIMPSSYLSRLWTGWEKQKPKF